MLIRFFYISLGSTPSTSGDTTIKVGSLLDDHQWHDMEIKRKAQNVSFTVDRLTIANYTLGDFFQLDLDRQVS